MEQKKRDSVLEALVVIVFFIASVALRLLYVGKHFDLLNSTNQLVEEVMLTTGNAIEYTIYGCKYLYAGILEILFSLLGNKPILSVYFQVILQCGAILLVYFAARKMIGKVGAIFSLLCFACIPYVTEAATGQFLLVMFCVYFFLNTTLWKYIQENNTIANQIAVTVLVAFATSSFAYLDVLGMLFSGIALFVTLLSAKQHKAAITISYLVGTLVGYATIMGSLVWIQGGTLQEKIREYVTLYFGKVEWQPLFLGSLEAITGSLPIVILMLVAFLLLWFVGIVKGNWKFGTGVTLLLVGILLFGFATIGTNDYLPIVMIGCILLLGNGIQALASIKRKVLREETQESGKIKEVGKIMESNKVEEPRNTEKHNMLQESIIIKEPIKTEKPVIQYIENPLPVPKKHVKKEMNYAFEPTGEFMKFDLEELSEKDDFDLS